MFKVNAIAWCEGEIRIPLESHLASVSLASRFLYEKDWARVIKMAGQELPGYALQLAAALHDVGKVPYAKQALKACSKGKQPSFAHHEFVSALAVAAMADKAEDQGYETELINSLNLSCLVALLHHHGMQKPFSNLIEYYNKTGVVLKGAGLNINNAVILSLRWLSRFATAILEEKIGQIVGKLASGAASNLEINYLIKRIENIIEDTSKRDYSWLTSAVTVATAAVSVADTLIASLERNMWDPSKLEGKWVWRVLNEKYGERREDIVKKIATLEKFYRGGIFETS